jgi:hypothetical protein
MAGDATFAAFKSAEEWLLAMAVHCVGFALVPK